MHLGQHPGRWINEARNTHPSTGRPLPPDAPRTPWRVIAYKMAAATGGEMIVSEPTIRKWQRRWVEEEFVDQLETDLNGAA
jgi:hypothetical protein